MEGRGSEGGQLSSTNPTKPAGTLALRNFTIPRKKRATGQVLLEPCPEESRDYSLIQSKLKEARLDMRKEHANAWLWKDVKLVHNEEFLKEYSEKRSEMRTKGRHGREMEERYCYLVASHETTTQIYRHGLRTETQQQYSLGKPSHGVYLFRHVDVALKHAASGSLTAKNLIVFKVLFGKVKKVTPTSDWNRTPDPMVTFDCHMSKEAVSHRESLSQQVLGSSVFLFDYNDNQELNSRPRQCLPYAVVSFVPAISATPPTSISPPVSPVKHPPSLSHGPLDHLRGCTVAKRRGKGENAKVTFKHFSTPAQTGCSGPEYTPPTPSTEMTTPPFQQYNQQNPLLFIPQQLHMPLYQTAGYFSPSLPYMDTSIPFQNYPNQSAFPSNGQLLNTPSIYGSNTSNGGVMPQTSTEKISTVVYSSRLVKDPRLSRQGSNPEQKGSEQEKANSSSETDNLRCQLQTQDGEDKNKSTGTVSCNKNLLEIGEEQSQDSHLKPSQEPESSPEPKNENMPSMKLFKMKFQKYATYLKMTEDERHKSVWSQQGMTPEQKQLLIDRIHFYDTYYQKYKQGLLFQKDTEAENVSSLSNMETKNSKPQQSDMSTLKESPLNTQESTENLRESQTRQSDASDVSTDLENTERPTVDLIKDAEGTESTKTTKETEKKDPPPELQESVVQSAVEVPSISLEASLDQDSLSLKKSTSENKEAVENFSEADSQQPSSPSSCPSEQDNKVNTLQAAIESLPQSSTTAATQSTLIITHDAEENPELEFHITDTDVAHCVDISVLDDVSENNDLATVTAEGLDQNHSESSTKNTSRGCLKGSKPDDTSEMSIEVKREELRQDNTIHSALYHRLQLDQLLPNLHGSGASPYKSYLRPKDLITTPSINQLCGHLHETMPKEGFNKAEMQNLQNWEKSEEDLHLTSMTMFQQVSARTKSLSLSERFSKLRTLRNHKKKRILDHGRTRKSTNSDTGHPIAGDLESHPECLPLSIHSNDKEKGSGIDNIKLIQLFSQRFNEARSLSGCKQLRGKHSKVLRRRNKPNSSVSSSNHSTHQRALHILRRHFGRRSNTKLSANGIFQGPKVLCTKSTSSTSQSSDPQNHQSHDNSCDNKPTPEEGKAHPSTEDHSCQDTPINGSKSISQYNGVSHITPYQSTEILSNDNPKKVQGDILLDVKHSVDVDDVTVDEVEPQERGTEDSSNCTNEESFPITCSESTKDGGIAKAQPTEEATPQKLSFVNATQVETDMCGTKEVSTNYNAGACRDQSNPVQEVSGILNNPSSGNTSSSCTAKAKPQSAMTPDLPGFMNMDDTEAKRKNNTGSGGIESVVDLTASEETGETTGDMDSNFRIVSNDMCSLGNITLARDNYLFTRGQTLEVNRRSLETLRSPNNDFIPSLILHPNEMRVSSSQQNPNANSSIINSHLKTYHPDLPDTIAKDAREPVAVLPGNLHSTWQMQENKTTVPSTSTETQLISKLRDYLTRFEITVKKQESVNDSVKDTQEVPMAWITLDSTVHKKQLFDTRHYNRLDLANLQHPGKDCTLNYMLPSTANKQATGKVIVINDAATFPVTPPKRKISKGRHQPKSYTSKRMRRSKLARVSPDSTSMLEPDQHPVDSHSHLVLQKDTSDQPQPQISTSIPNLQQLSQNRGTPVQQNQILVSQSLENLNGPSAQPIASQGPRLLDIADKLNEQSLYGKNDKNPYNQKQYSVTDISITLKLADHAVSVVELCSLQLKCKSMLRYFISIFERDQKVPFLQSCISRNLILDKYLDHPPEPMELKFEALNSFLELQMMVEAYQFVENKINFLSRKATFRSLLWYDPSLYGELYKGAVGFQQQSSLFSSFQQGIATEGYRKLQEYYTAVSTLHQQLQDSPDTSYYMYLKSKRERLEVEAALRNPPDIKSFFLSVPVALMMNLGDNLESLEKSHRIVMSFVETPSDRLPGVFDVGKAEHLSIMCRYLQEKVIFLKSKEQISKVSWFGLEHLLYDASKLLVWRESEHGMSSEVLLQYKRSNPQIVYGVTEAGVPLVNKIEQHPAQTAERARITPEQQMVDGSKNYRDKHSEISTENTHSVQGNQTEESMKERNQQVRRRATHPPVRSNLNDGGLCQLNPVQPSVPAQLGNPTPLPAFSQQSNAVHWRMAGPQAWDWKPPGVGQTSKSTPEIRALLLSKRRMTIPSTEPRVDLRTNPASTWLPPYNISPRAAERITLHHQPTLSTPHHAELRKEQGSEAKVPLIKPIPLQCLPPDTSSLSVPHLPFPNTSNQLPSHEIPMPINYPYFLFNGKTYSTVAPSVPVPGPVLHTETQYHQPHPV